MPEDWLSKEEAIERLVKRFRELLEVCCYGLVIPNPFDFDQGELREE